MTNTKNVIQSNNKLVRLRVYKDLAWDEYQVRWTDYTNGKWIVNEDKMCPCADQEDAQQTMKMIIEHYNKYGN